MCAYVHACVSILGGWGWQCLMTNLCMLIMHVLILVVLVGWLVEHCFMSTETVGLLLLRWEPRMATSTFTQLLSSGFYSSDSAVCVLFLFVLSGLLTTLKQSKCMLLSPQCQCIFLHQSFYCLGCLTAEC